MDFTNIFSGYSDSFRTGRAMDRASLPRRAKPSNEEPEDGSTFRNTGRSSPPQSFDGAAREEIPRSQAPLPSIRSVGLPNRRTVAQLTCPQLFTSDVLEPRSSRLEVDPRLTTDKAYPAILMRPDSSSDYTQLSPTSHGKRRKLSEDPGVQSNSQSPQRQYRSPRLRARPHSATSSPTDSFRRFSIPDQGPSAWPSPHSAGGLPPMRAAPYGDSPGSPSSEWRPTLPSLPALSTNHLSNGSRAQEVNEYALAPSRAQAYSQQPQSQFNYPSYHQPTSYNQQQPSYQHSAYPQPPYGYQQPRGHSFSGTSPFSSPHERSPFSSAHNAGYSSNAYYGLDGDGDIGNKKGKRRGNLPKETTDKLRAWFHSNLVHPYPTEDQKQELMQQTGLQMSECFPEP